jgi:hypothetical protein
MNALSVWFSETKVIGVDETHLPNALETIDNEALQLIIYCFNAFGA